jgi:hypothetical protein
MGEGGNSVEFYADEDYSPILHLPFRSWRNRPIRLRDAGSAQICRFCSRTNPAASFRKKSHAVPEFFGNKVILSENECDDCNHALAAAYEDDLSQATLVHRTLSQIRGKRGLTTFKDNNVSFRPNGIGHDIALTSEEFAKSIDLASKRLELPPLKSGAFVPIRAAMALVKIAISICPQAEFDQLLDTVKWLMGQQHVAIARFLVLYSFHPNSLSRKGGSVTLWKRQHVEVGPYLWCTLRSAHHRYQWMIPGCAVDVQAAGPSGRLPWPAFKHLPTKIDGRKDASDFAVQNWGSTKRSKNHTLVTLTLQFPCDGIIKGWVD